MEEMRSSDREERGEGKRLRRQRPGNLSRLCLKTGHTHGLRCRRRNCSISSIVLLSSDGSGVGRVGGVGGVGGGIRKSSNRLPEPAAHLVKWSQVVVWPAAWIVKVPSRRQVRSFGPSDQLAFLRAMAARVWVQNQAWVWSTEHINWTDSGGLFVSIVRRKLDPYLKLGHEPPKAAAATNQRSLVENNDSCQGPVERRKGKGAQLKQEPAT